MTREQAYTMLDKWRFEAGGTLLHKEVKRLRVGVGKCVDTDFWLRCPEHTESELG